MGSLYRQNFVDDVILCKRRKAVYFRALGLKPKSHTRAYINDVEVTDFCLGGDIIQINYSKTFGPHRHYRDWNWHFKNGEKFYIYDYGISGGTKVIAKGRVDYIEHVSYNRETDIGVANVHVFIEGPGTDTLYNTLDTERVKTSNTTYIKTSHVGRTANNQIIAYYPKYSVVKNATANTIEFSGKFQNSNVENNLVGTTLYIVSGYGAGQNAVISAYNTSTRVATISGEWDLLPGAISNTSIDVSDRAMVRLGNLYSDSTGTLPGMFMMPSIIDHDLIEGSYGYRYWRRWWGWHRRFRIYKKNYVRFESYLDNGSTVISTGSDGEVGDTEVPTDSTVVVNPFAQTFFIDESLHPQGVTLTSVKLLFKEKDETYPVQIQIRPTTASIPSTSSYVTNGSTYLQPDDINLISLDTIQTLNVDGINPFSNTAYYSEAFFNAPVFLEPGKEYAVVIASATSKHEVYISDVGQRLLGTNRIISTQPYLGVLYKMQNSSTWEPFANQDLCFELNKATYDTVNPANIDLLLMNLNVDANGVVDVDNAGIQGLIDLQATVPTANIPIDGIFINSNGVVLANTKMEYSFRSTRSDGSYDTFKDIEPETTYEFSDSFGPRQLNSNNSCFVLRVKMYATNPDIAPYIDVSKLNLVTIRNIIDDNGIANSDVFITNIGQDYSNSQNVIVTISDGGGTGATARANVVNGSVDFIEILTPGSGYTSSPTITISGDTTSTINAEAVIIGEDQPNGGVGDAKYITRKVTLTDGFLGGDLRVLFTAYKPSNATIDVYYKVLSQDDADNFDNKRWTQMTMIGGIGSNSISKTDLKKYIYAPGSNNLADNFIKYDGFTNFKYFAIKLVLRSTDSTRVPQISEFRAIALSELL